MMSQHEWNGFLATLPVRTVNAILSDLAMLRAQYNAGRKVSLPLVQVTLSSGQQLEGYVVAVDSPRNEETLVLHSPRGEHRFPHYDLIYVRTNAIMSVSILDAHTIAKFLNDKAHIPAEQEIVTRIDVKRFIAQYMDDFNTLKKLNLTCDIDWDTIPAGASALRNLKEEVATVLDALTEIMDEEDKGYEVLTSSVCGIILKSHEHSGAAFEEGTLTILCPYLDAPRRISDREGIKRAIEEALQAV
ncbi:MAG: hypothetical protein RML40_05910 [Bacteroidota bacterium]|nr:hypothetical protein [Candidatus Kapabacteria bacterium]MDW8220048.1 hypothetical protein [Bacteroidota bacterium]